MAATVGLRERCAAFFAVDDDWVRPARFGRADVVVGVGTFAISILMLELVRSVGTFGATRGPWWLHWLVVAAACALLVVRRRFPLTVLTLAGAHMFLAGITLPAVMGQASLQIVYFVAILSGVAWARSRRQMLAVVGVLVAFMALWLAWQIAVGQSTDALLEELGLADGERPGVFGPVLASVLITAVVNAVYFGGAVVGGQMAWRSARQRARLAEQTATIARQADELQHRAVVEERVRIARELHDVVAHHVSVIGIQAAAGRRMLGRDTEAVSAALAHVEDSSREAVAQMRSLVGTLRDPARDEERAAGPRSPEPGFGQVADLVTDVSGAGLRVDYDLVENPPGAAACLEGPLGTSVYRIVQEALTNVRRHSTAANARVVLRVDQVATPPYAEVEVTDDGRPRAGSSGSGLGLLGVRERAAARRGQVEIGPRAVGGYRVRVRYPLEPA